MSICSEMQIAHTVQLLGKEIELLLTLYPLENIAQLDLAKSLGIKNSNLSKRLKNLKEAGFIHVFTIKSSLGRPPNYVSLDEKTRRMIKMIIGNGTKPNDKTIIPHPDSFSEIINLLMDPFMGKAAADQVQLASQKYLLSSDSYYFDYLSKNLTNSNLVPVLRVILSATRSFIKDFSDTEKAIVSVLFEDRVMEVLSTNYNASDKDGIHNEARLLMESMGVIWAYDDLMDQYISEIKIEGGRPEIYRRLLLKNFRNRVHEVWVIISRLTEDDTLKSRVLTELQLLRA